MSEALFEILNDQNLGARTGIPREFCERLELVLAAPGEGADHAICEITIRLRWLFYLDPNWVKSRLIPWFSIEAHEAPPAWNALLHDNQLWPVELFTLLKSSFLRVFEVFTDWHWDDQPVSRLHEFLVLACYWHKKSGKYVDYAEARLALQRSNDDGRSHAIWFLSSIIADENVWNSFGKPFVLKAWPKEARCQTEASSRQLATIAEASGENFPDVVRTIGSLLVPSAQLDVFVYNTNEQEKGDDESRAKLPRKFPNAMLTLLDRLVPDDPSRAPYGLGPLINIIVEADAGLRQDSRWRRLNRIVHAQ